MRKKLAVVYIISILVAGTVILWAALSISKGSNISPASNPAISDGTFIEGLRYKVYRNGVVVSEAEAEGFKIIPKKFFVFKIKSINEAVITNARIKIFERNALREGGGNIKDDPFNSLFTEFTDKESGAGLITKAVVKGIDVNMYDAKKRMTHHLTAANADLKAGANQTAFYDAAIEHPPSGLVVRTEKLLWDGQEKEFKAPGQYTASGPQGEFEGKGVLIDLNFKMRQTRSF